MRIINFKNYDLNKSNKLKRLVDIHLGGDELKEGYVYVNNR